MELTANAAPAEPVVIPRAAWRVAILAGMASYLDAGAIVTSGAALVLYKDAFGLTLDQIGQLSAMLTLLFAVGALIGGRLGDRFGRRRVFSITLLGLAVGIAMMAFANGVPMLYAATAVVGFCIGADLPVSMAMIAEEAPPGAKGRMVAFSHVLWMVAIITVLMCQTAFGHLGATGARYMWLHLLIVAIIVLVARTTLPESREWTRAQAAAAEPQAQEGTVDSGRLRDLLRGPWLAPLVALALFYGIVNLSANTGGQFGTLLYTQLGGLSVSAAGAVNLAGFGVAFVSTLAFMRLIDRPSRMTLFLVGGVIYTAAQALPLVFGYHAWTLMGWTMLSGIGGAFAGEPMWKIWSQELFPTLLRSTAQGATTFFTRVLAAAAALVTPRLMDAGPDVLFGALTAAVAFTTALGWFAIRRFPRVMH